MRKSAKVDVEKVSDEDVLAMVRADAALTGLLFLLDMSLQTSRKTRQKPVWK